MMQHENGDCGRKSCTGERKERRIGLHDGVPICDSKPSGKLMAPLEARYARRETPQCRRARAGSGAQFEHVVSQRIFGQDPRQQMVTRDALPKTRRAKPIFECVQFSTPINVRRSLEVGFSLKSVFTC